MLSWHQRTNQGQRWTEDNTRTTLKTLSWKKGECTQTRDWKKVYVFKNMDLAAEPTKQLG